jgi:Ca2+-binding EF-hand superfamily protein
LDVEIDDHDEMRELLDPQGDGWVTYSVFLNYAAPRLFHAGHEVDDDEHMEEVQKAFDQFTQNGPGPISFAHLRRVSKMLKLEVNDEQLANMIKVANGREGKRGWEAGVTMTEFERVLGDAGMWK